MVNLTRIYTRTGDDGTTSSGDMSRTGKNDSRLQAYADVDEANSTIGVRARARRRTRGGSPPSSARSRTTCSTSAPTSARRSSADPAVPPLRVTSAYVDALEAACDEHNERLDKLRSFVLPGGTPPLRSCTSPAPWSVGRNGPPGSR